MKSSSGQYFIALDHIRALAALLVFVWHFTHYSTGYPVLFEFVPSVFIFSVFDEGHTGVALFMTLSGYLFAKLLDGKKIYYFHFLWNRFLRLAPLLFLVMAIVGLIKFIDNQDLTPYFWELANGFIKPSWPNGGWSITAEFHFYLILPILLFISWKYKFGLLAIVGLMICLRLFMHHEIGEIQWYAYWTIVGRLDQFLLGAIAYKFASEISGKHILFLIATTLFLLFYWWFDSIGGFMKNPGYPSPSRIWILMPTIEGCYYGLLIAWYDNSFKHNQGPISLFIAKIGAYSYSIYLLHFFFVFKMSRYINDNIIDISNFYLAFILAVFCFLAMIPLAYLSYRFVESPFLKLRTNYLK